MKKYLVQALLFALFIPGISYSQQDAKQGVGELDAFQQLRNVTSSIEDVAIPAGQALKSNKAGIFNLEKALKEASFVAPPFRETIRTIEPEIYTTRVKIDSEVFAMLIKDERQKILKRCVEYYGGDYVHESQAVAEGWSVWSNGGFNNKYAINALLGIIENSHKAKVQRQLPRFGTYYHMRLKYEEAEPVGWDLFVIVDNLLSMGKGKVLVLKVYYSYYN